MPAAIPIVLTAAATAASAAGAAGIGFFGTAVLGGLTTVGALVGGALSIAASLVGAILNKPPDAAKQSIEAAVPRVDAKPPKRLALGRYKFGGRIVMRGTKSDKLYIAYLVASHQCAVGTWDLFIDDRQVEAWDGDPFDMGVGATATSPGVLAGTKFWISGGDHTQPPQSWIDDGVLLPTDRWDGLSMVWVLSPGVKAKDFNKKYPRGGNREVQLLCDGGKWIDPATGVETYSATPARIAYALMQHELGLGYDASDIDANSFAAGAVIEETPIPLAGGGTHPRYAINGVIDLTSDRGDFISAIQNVSASQIVLRGGVWGYLPGVGHQSIMVLTQDHIAGPPSLTLNGDSDARMNTVEGSFIDPTLYTTATVPLYRDAAALAEDGVERLSQPQYPHVTEPVQAQRLDRIALRGSRLQRSMTCAFAGRAIFLTQGDVVTTNFGLPFWADGQYIVRKAKLQIADNDGTPVETNQLELRQYDPTIYDWEVADEQPYIAPTTTDTNIGTHAAPASIAVTWSGGGAQISVPLDPAARSVEWEYSLNTGGVWLGLPEIVTSEADPVVLRQEAVPPGAIIRWRVRYAGGELLTGPWAVTADYLAPSASAIPAPTGAVSSSTSDSITINWSIPNDARIDALEIYRSTDPGEIDPMAGERIAFAAAAQGAVETYSDSGLATGDYRYWARCYGGLVAGEWSPAVDRTI